jgi:hypothetical protein
VRPRAAVVLAAAGLLLAGCGSERSTPVAVAPPAPAPPPARPLPAGPVLNPDGSCSAPAPTAAAEIAPGIGECELPRLKGRPPTDVLVGESGRGQREVQVLYTEPGAKELYFFVNNRLDRIVK